MPAVQKAGSVSLSNQQARLNGSPKTLAGFKKRSHLRKADEISSVFGFKCRVSSSHFSILGKPNSLTYPRLAIMVAKKTAPLAVRRNYMRRVIREMFRGRQASIAPLDIVVRIVQPFNKPDFQAISQELADIFVKVRKCHES